MDITTILSTEMRLLEPICEFIEIEGGSLFRSSRFRNYYGGNGITLHDPLGRSLVEWEEVFAGFFDPSLYEHTTFLFPREERFGRLIDEARAAGYHVSFDTYMFVDNTDLCRPIPPELELHRVQSEREWEKLAEFRSASYEGGDWYDPEYDGPDRLFEKTRFTSEQVGIDWFYLAGRGEEEMLASLGLFTHNGICRLQDVETAEAHRRKGLASVLVSAAIDRAINVLGTRGVALCADSDYHAVDLYHKLGFVDVGDAVTLMKYPVKNPAFIK